MNLSLRIYVLVAIAASLVFGSAATAQPIIYVDADATGSDNGTSWADAYEELDDALEVAADGAQIWVAEGVYKPTDDPDRTESFFLKSGVEVLGGFTGTETSADDRIVDPDENGTVLSCDIGVIDDPSDNCYHVVTAIDVDGTAVLDGFLVTGGTADGSAPNERGGGLTNYDGVTTGADTEGYPTLRNVLFEGNTATFGGGAYFNAALGAVTFEDVEFKENEAFQGGGMYTNTDVEMEGVEFEENAATQRGGGAWFSGGTSILRDVEFDANEVGSDTEVGGGAGVHVRAGTSLTLIDVVFERNRAPLDLPGSYGGGLEASATASVDMVNATFIGNVAYGGAGFYMREDAAVRVTNALFAGNRNEESVFGIITVDGPNEPEAALTNVTVAGNRGATAIITVSNVPMAVNNVIIWDNIGSAIELFGDGAVEVDHAIVEGGFSGGEAVLSDDPLFLRVPDAGDDGEWGTEDDDYGNLRLDEGSPALAFGDLDLVPEDEFDLDGDGVTGELLPFDLDGEARVQGGSVELGAYEGIGSPVASEDGASVPGSLALSAAYPNPARGRSTLVLTLESADRVEVAVYDVLGRRVARLHDGPLASGTHPFTIGDAALPAGLYLVRAASAAGTATRRITILR
jgi:hypothetical protein